MNKIVIELCKEDRQRIDELICFAGLLVGELKDRRPPVVEGLTYQGPRMEQAADGTVKLVPEHPADAPTTHLEPPAPAPDPAPEVKPVSLGEFQKAIVTRCAESEAVKKKVQTLVYKYADSVSNIPEGMRHEVLAALAKI